MSEAAECDVAVIVPSYRSNRQHLERCCEAVEAAARRASGWTFQWWLVDDGCPDGVGREVAQDRPGWKVVRTANQGLPAARNTGIAHASATWLHFIDDDDTIDEQFYAAMQAACRARPDVQWAYGNWLYFDASTETAHGAPAPEVLQRRLISGNCFPVNAGWVSAAKARSVGGFNPELGAMEDWDFWLRCLRSGGPVMHVPQAQARVRIHPDSMSVDQTHMHRWMCRVCEQVALDEKAWDALGVDWERFAAAWGTYAVRAQPEPAAVRTWWRWGAGRWGMGWWLRACWIWVRAALRRNRSPHATLSADGEHRDRQLPMQ